MKWSKRPIIFDHNRITRSYIGGELLNDWRGMDVIEDGHNCEELLATSIGAISEGKPEGYAISKTVEGISLTELIKEDPEGILGSAYQQYNPNHLSVLARAGDTIVRLVMQCHPKKQDAQYYFQEQNGKAEAWYIARTRTVAGEENCVYAGFKQGVTSEQWKQLIQKQDIAKMLTCMHRLPVKSGDVILIPAGMPHAVGPGCIFLEIHECSDITIRVERKINDVTLTDREMYNGLCEEEGLTLFDYTTYDEASIAQTCMMEERNLQVFGNSKIVTAIDHTNTDAFSMKILYIDKDLPLQHVDAHRILVPTDGDIMIQCVDNAYRIPQGWGCLLPAALGDVTLIAVDGVAKAVLGLPKEML